MYWADSGTGKIQRAILTGTNVKDIITTSSLEEPSAIALDLRVPGDCDGDWFVALADHALFLSCMTGPGVDFVDACSCADASGDRDVDLNDFL